MCFLTDIQILVIWLVELTSRDIHYYSHPHQRSKSPIRPWGIVFPIQQLGSSLFPMFLSSRAPLLKQRSTCAKGCDPIDINFLHCCQPNKQNGDHNRLCPTFVSIYNIDLKDLLMRRTLIYFKNTSDDKDLYYVSYIKQIFGLFHFMEWEGLVKFGLPRHFTRQMEQSKFDLAIIFLPFHSEPLNIYVSNPQPLSVFRRIESDHCFDTSLFCRYGILVDPISMLQVFLHDPYSLPSATLAACKSSRWPTNKVRLFTIYFHNFLDYPNPPCPKIWRHTARLKKNAR